MPGATILPEALRIAVIKKAPENRPLALQAALWACVPGTFWEKPFLFDGQDISETCNVKNLPDDLIHMHDLHPAFGGHRLVGRQKDTEPG